MSSLGLFLTVLVFTVCFFIYVTLRLAVELGKPPKRTPLISFVLLPAYKVLRVLIATIVLLILLFIAFLILTMYQLQRGVNRPISRVMTPDMLSTSSVGRFNMRYMAFGEKIVTSYFRVFASPPFS